MNVCTECIITSLHGHHGDYKFLCKDTNVGLTARSSRWFAAKISTLTGRIFEQNLALKPILLRLFASKFNSSPEALEVEGEIICFLNISIMTKNASKERKTPSWLKTRTASEENAYNAFSLLMQQEVQRNPRYHYAKRIVYRPDLLFPKSKIWIEIDGSSHIGKEEKDKRRDERLTERGFVVLRFKNEETEDRRMFQRKLLHRLRLIVDRNDRPRLNDYIRSLENMLFYDFDKEEYGLDESDLD